ncbi:hypothetical protein GE09DRAFT_1061142 [Coniochaeta sp. 2T2.1]|nr:hypothetical protein GE09DRAFT_1061142 [Coniochaeta sp. 2T2.1]
MAVTSLKTTTLLGPSHHALDTKHLSLTDVQSISSTSSSDSREESMPVPPELPLVPEPTHITLPICMDGFSPEMQANITAYIEKHYPDATTEVEIETILDILLHVVGETFTGNERAGAALSKIIHSSNSARQISSLAWKYLPAAKKHQVYGAVAARPDHRVVHISELPTGKNFIVQSSSFFRRNPASLPSPDNGADAAGPRPPPVRFEELGLIVKYGLDITIAEGQCLWYLNKHMKDEVPTPELFGWRRDNGETFIYMQLIHGKTMEEAWPSLSPDERSSICEQLRGYVKAWQRFAKSQNPTSSVSQAILRRTFYLRLKVNLTVRQKGHVRRQGAGDIIFTDAMDPNPGPFVDLTEFHDYFARYSSRLHPEWDPQREFPELAGLTDDRAVVFAHADLCMRNIMVSSRDAQADPGSWKVVRTIERWMRRWLGLQMARSHCSAPKVVAIVDWHQSGWYPAGWEWLKAQAMCEPFPTGGGRDTQWLEQILTPADEGYAYGWGFITSSV